MTKNDKSKSTHTTASDNQKTPKPAKRARFALEPEEGALKAGYTTSEKWPPKDV